MFKTLCRLLVTLAFGLILIFSIVAQASDIPVVLIESGPEANAMAKVAEAYQKATGNNIELQIVGRKVMFPLMTKVLLARSSDIDLIYGGSYKLYGYAAAGVLEPLDPFINDPELTPAEYDLNDVLDTYKFEGKTYGIPFDTSGWFLYYRKDLIPEPPQTWEELTEIAKKFTKSINPDSPTKYGLGYYGHIGRSGSRFFAPILWSYGGQIVDDKGNVKLDEPEAIKAGELLANWKEEGILSPEVPSWGYSEVKSALENGVVPMAAPFPNAAYTTLQGEYKDKIAVALTPGNKTPEGLRRITYHQGLVLMMNQASNKKRAAWDFIKYLTGKEGMLVYVKAGGTASRKSILTNPDIVKERPEFPLLAKTLESGRTNPPITYWETLQETMNIAFSEIFAGQKTVEEAFGEAAKSLREMQNALR